MNKTWAFLKQTLIFKTWKGLWGEVRLWINLTFIYFFGSINTVSFLCVRSQLTEMTSCNSNENNVLWGVFLGAPCTADGLNQYPSIPLPPTWEPSTATKGYFVSSLCSYKLVLQKAYISAIMNSLGLDTGPHLDSIILNVHSNHVVVSTIYGCYALFRHN